MNIKFKKGIDEKSGSLLSKWSNEKGQEFQEQWMGDKISYPLNHEKLKGLQNLYSIYDDDEFLGVIQQIRIDGNNIHLGRFMINPGRTGLGYGKEALNEFINLCFMYNSVNSISLTVFDYNKNAKILYEKIGFEIDEVVEENKLKYIMKKYR